MTDAIERSMGLEAIVRGGSKTKTLEVLAEHAKTCITSCEATLMNGHSGMPYLTAAAAYVQSILVVLKDGRAET